MEKKAFQDWARKFCNGTGRYFDPKNKEAATKHDPAIRPYLDDVDAAHARLKEYLTGRMSSDLHW